MFARRPNVLFIMVDQQRHDYLGYAGGSHLHTPNLDALAAAGTAFTQCTSNAPVCAPARVALATGQQPLRMGALGNDCFLPLSRPTLYRRFRDHGYRVGCVGKLDLAKPDGYNGRDGDRPLCYAWGFTHPEECEGKMHAGRGRPPNGPYTNWLRSRGLLDAFVDDYTARQAAGWCGKAAHDSALPADAFEDCYIGRRAAEWIERAPDDFPWHYFVSFVGPHNPFDPPREYADLYRDAAMPEPVPDDLEDKPARWRQRAGKRPVETDDERLHARRQYCGAISAIDDAVGWILEALERRGQRERTYIVFTSDHGEMLGDHGLYTKDTFYETSLRVPLVVAGPGLPDGTRSEALVELIDLNPTVCELAGVPPIPATDAISLAPLLRGEVEAVHEEAVAYLHHGRCARTRRYKAIDNLGDRPELYDLEADPGETTNIAEREPELLQDLVGRPRRRMLAAGCMR